LVNLRAEGEYMIVDKVATQFTLRANSKTVCLYNRQTKSKDLPAPIADIFGPLKDFRKTKRRQFERGTR
jgi:type IV secretion system protein VirB9